MMRYFNMNFSLPINRFTSSPIFTYIKKQFIHLNTKSFFGAIIYITYDVYLCSKPLQNGACTLLCHSFNVLKAGSFVFHNKTY